jgi:hypothetical protein
LRGLTTGYVELASADSVGTCIIVGGQFSSWIPALAGLRLEPLAIFVDDDRAIAVVRSAVGLNTIIAIRPN